jgi:hypothetical protein
MVTVAICPACGYPTVGPDLCFYCRPAAIIPLRDVATKANDSLQTVAPGSFIKAVPIPR